MMKRLTVDKGVNKDLLPAELQLGYVSDALNWRFRNGFAETFDGIAVVFTTPAVTPYWLGIYPATSGSRYLIEAGIAKVYSDDGTTQTQITRIREPSTISSMVRDGGGTNFTVTTATAHGLSATDVVVISDSVPSAGESFNGTWTIASVGSATTFTITQASVNPGATATTVGYYKVTTSSATSDFTGAVDDRWTGGVLSGIQILNNPVDGLYYWQGSGKLSRLFASASSAVPIANKADVAKPFKAFIVQLAPTISGTKYPQRVAWAESAEPGSLPTTFTAADTNDAGDVDLAETPGFLVDCLVLGDINYIYKQDAIYGQQYIGGNDVFRFYRIPGNDGLLARGCIASADDFQVFISASKDIKIHRGDSPQSIAEGRIKDYFQSNLDSTYASRSFLAVNSNKKEIWVCYPKTNATSCNEALVWNWKDDTWSIRELSGVTFGATGLLPTSIATDSRLVLSTTTPRIGLVDSGTTDFGAAVTKTIERVGVHFDDTESVKTLHASRLQMDATAGVTASVYHGSAMTADGTVTYASAVTHTQGTSNKVNAFANGGRYLAHKVTTTGTAKLRSIDLEFNVGGGY